MQREDLGDGWVALAPGLIGDHAAVMTHLVATLPLRQETVRVFGKEHPTPRLTSWHGDPGNTYRYSGRTFEPAPWTDALLAIRDALTPIAGLRFDSVLANLYRDGQDAMGVHADDEPELGPTEDDVRIGSVSLGARRRFVLRRRDKSERRVYELGEGDALVMGGALQRTWVHHVPRTRRAVGPRLNLTFRVLRAPSDRHA